MDDDAIDAALVAAFAASPPRPDPAFVRRVEAAVRADQALRAARERAWREFGTEALVIAAIAAVLVTVWRVGAFGAGLADGGLVAVMMLGLGCVAMARPALREQ